MDKYEEIIKGCKEGNRVYQEKLYKLVSPMLYGICLRYGNNTEDAQDILQDGFIKIFQKISQFNYLGSFEGWMKRIIINTALEKYRSRKYLNEFEDNITLHDKTIDEHTTNNLTTEELMKLVMKLPPQYKLVFNLYAIEGYNHKEISKMLKISEGTSKSNLSRARAILQKQINQLYKVPDNYFSK